MRRFIHYFVRDSLKKRPSYDEAFVSIVFFSVRRFDGRSTLIKDVVWMNGKNILSNFVNQTWISNYLQMQWWMQFKWYLAFFNPQHRIWEEKMKMEWAKIGFLLKISSKNISGDEKHGIRQQSAQLQKEIDKKNQHQWRPPHHLIVNLWE